MGSVFVNAGLAAGVALAAIPVILHLFMRPTPKHVVFPALRLVRERHKRSKRKMRVKNWLLLLARMGLLALMALALARPRVDAKVASGDREVPMALGLVFDTTLSMAYKERGQTRLDEAKKKALEVLARTNETSDVFVVDSAEPGAVVALSPSAARKRIEGLTLRPANRPLNPAMGQVYSAVSKSEKERREVYVLTDLAASAWQLGSEVEGLAAARKLKNGVQTYLIRLAPKDARDVAVVQAAPSASMATPNDPVEIAVKVRASGQPARRVVELLVDGVKRNEKPVEIPANSEIEVPPFLTPKLPVGLHRVQVKLGGEPDPLEINDVRYLTLNVQPAQRVLVVSDLALDADYVANALDPEAWRGSEGRPFLVDRILASQLDARLSRPLRDYAAVFVLNVATLDSGFWSRLAQYVREGGGVVIAPGQRAVINKYNADGAGLLPATLGQVQKHADSFTFGNADLSHPLFSVFARELLAELARVPIYKSRSVAPLQGSRAVLSYQDGTPALLERVFPGVRPGRVLLWTTPLSRRPEPNSPEHWNDFPTSWSFVALVCEAVPYLAGLVGEQLNYDAGEEVTIALDPTKRFTGFRIQGPDAKLQSERLPEPISNAMLRIDPPPALGNWTVEATGPEQLRKVLGFSVNVPASECALATLEERQLDGLFGKDQYQLVDKPEDLKRAQERARIGVEVFPWIMAIILVLITLENLLANTFYKERPRATA